MNRELLFINEQLQEKLNSACELAVQLFGASHATYLHLSPGGEVGIVAAESRSEIRSLGSKVPIKGIELEEEFINLAKPIIIADVSAELRLGPVREQLMSVGVKSLMLIPVHKKDGKLFGSFSLDWTSSASDLPKADDPRCNVFSTFVGLIIEIHTLHDVEERRRKLLERLEEFTSELYEIADPQKVLFDITRLAVELVSAAAGALYENHNVIGRLELKASYKAQPGDFELPSEMADIASLTANSRVPRINHTDLEAFVNGRGTIAAIPLKHVGQVRYALVVCCKETRISFVDVEQQVLERYASRALQALLFAELMDPSSDWNSNASLLNHLSAFMQSQLESDGGPQRILHALLTGLTASFGLRFNRATALMHEKSYDVLSHQLSIGQLDRESWAVECERSRKAKLNDLHFYLSWLRERDPEPSQLHLAIGDFRWQIGREGDPLTRAWVTMQPDWARVSDLPSDLILGSHPESTVGIVPLRAASGCLGVVLLNNEFTGLPITEADLDAAAVLANVAATNLETLRLFRERKDAELRLRALLKTASSFGVERSFREVLEQRLLRTCLATKASGAGIILSADGNHAWLHVAAGTEQQYLPEVVMRQHGISSQVMRGGVPEPIPFINARKDDMNPATGWSRYRSAICLPLRVRGTCIGVMWLLYEEHHDFAPEEVDELQHDADSTAVAYDYTVRRAELHGLRAAALSMSEPTESAVKRIPEQAMKLTGAEAATFWPYDHQRKQFIGPPLFGGEFRPERYEPPSQHGFTARMLTRGYLAEEVTGVRVGRIYDIARTIGLTALQAVCVRTSVETVGVLFLGYRNRRAFDEEDQRQLESFAALAAPLLAAERLTRTREAFRREVEDLARRTAAGDLAQTLKHIVVTIRSLYNCGPVLLYLIDPWTRQVQFPPTMDGVRDEAAVVEQDRTALESILGGLLKSQRPYKAENIADELAHGNPTGTIFDGTRFHRHEGTKACAAFVLRAAGYLLGLLFVNLCDRPVFAAGETESVNFFANQAAIAILPDYLLQSSFTAIKGLTHSIRGPLTFVKRTLEFALLDKYGPVNQRLYLEIQQSLVRLERGFRGLAVLDTLLFPEEGLLPRLEYVDVAEVVRQCVDELKLLLSDSEVEADAEIQSGISFVLTTDRNLLENILSSMLDNARKYTESGSIRVKLTMEDDWASIAILDSGIGIPWHDRDKVFERLTRGSNVGGREGSGVGLYIARKWANVLGGDIVLLHSSHKGSIFQVRIPRGSKWHIANES